jgi:hypothetical protein
MGYEVHITRAHSWLESKNNPISFDEWVAYVENDQEMMLSRFAEVTLEDGRTLRYENEGLAVWIAYSGHNVGGNMAWFDYRDGRIDVNNPNQEIIRKMHQIAVSLGAWLQGDEGEFYDKFGNLELKGYQRPKPWWKKIFGL